MRKTCSSALSGICIAFSIVEEISDEAKDRLRKGFKALWDLMADNDIRSGTALSEIWPDRDSHAVIANRILSRIREFPFHRYSDDGVNIGWEAMEGLVVLLKYIELPGGTGNMLQPIKPKRLKRLILALFNKHWMGESTEKLVKVLRLIRKADTELSSEAKAGLRILLKNTQTRNSLFGTWFQLKYMDEIGFRNILGVEVPRPSSSRGIDIITTDGRFFELKSGSSGFDANQMVSQLSEPPVLETPAGWRRYKHVTNVSDENLIASVDESNAGLFFKELWHKLQSDASHPMHEFLDELKTHLAKDFPNLNWDDMTDRHNWHSPTVNSKYASELIEIRKYVAEQFFDSVSIPDIEVPNVPELGS